MVAVGTLARQGDGVFAFAASQLEDNGVVVAEKLVPASAPFEAVLFKVFERHLEEVGKRQVLFESCQFVFAH